MAEVPDRPAAQVVVSAEDLRTVLQSEMPLRFRHGWRPYVGAYERLLRAIASADVDASEAGEGLTAQDAEQLRTAIQEGRGRSEDEIRADESRKIEAEQKAAGLVVVGVCACGQPLGTCPCCGDSRCWRCDPSKDTNAAEQGDGCCG